MSLDEFRARSGRGETVVRAGGVAVPDYFRRDSGPGELRSSTAPSFLLEANPNAWAATRRGWNSRASL